MSSALSIKNCAEYSIASMPHSSFVTLATSKCFIVLPNKARWNAHSPNEILKSGCVSAASARRGTQLKTVLPARAAVVDFRNSLRVEERVIRLVLNRQNQVNGLSKCKCQIMRCNSDFEKDPVFIEH